MQKVGIYRHLNMLLVNLIQTKQFVPFPYKSCIDNTPKGGKNISININPDVFNAIQNSYQYRIATSLSIYISINSYKYNSQVKQNNTKAYIIAQLTFQSKDSRIGIHKSRISSDRPPQRLHRHVHIYNNHAVLRSRFSNAYILIRLHRHVRESDELWIYANARQSESFSHGDRSVGGGGHGGLDRGSVAAIEE